MEILEQDKLPRTQPQKLSLPIVMPRPRCPCITGLVMDWIMTILPILRIRRLPTFHEMKHQSGQRDFIRVRPPLDQEVLRLLWSVIKTLIGWKSKKRSWCPPEHGQGAPNQHKPYCSIFHQMNITKEIILSSPAACKASATRAIRPSAARSHLCMGLNFCPRQFE